VSSGRKTGRAPATVGGKRTRLQAWLDEHGFTSVQLEEKTGIGRQAMTKIRAGRDVRRKTMLKILKGARELKGAVVTMDELFDLDPDSPFNQF
jgi:transcriptional regulator with XRE-family HTH domain